MNTRKWSSFILPMILSLLLMSCTTPATAPQAPAAPTALSMPATLTQAPSTSTSTTAVTPTPRPKYAPAGPLGMTVKSYVINEGDLAVSTAIWYPVNKDGTPDTAHGPYPLVLLSPYAGGNYLDYHFIFKQLTGYGFVIMSGVNIGKNRETDTNFWSAAANRPRVIQILIKEAEKITAPGGDMPGMIDTEHIALFGHQVGGWAALMVAGAQMDLGWCTAHPEVMNNTMSCCAQFVPHQQDIAAMLGLKSAPTGLWPQVYDPRIDAIVVLGPDGDVFGTEYVGLAGMKVPAMVITGSLDLDIPPQTNAFPVYQHLGSQKKSLVVFEGAGSDLGWERNGDVAQHIITAFLLAELKGDPEAIIALSPDNLKFKVIRYETTEFNAK